MYKAYYIFYKHSFPGGEKTFKDVQAKEFDSPHEEHSFTRDMRMDGYFTKRVPEDIYKIMVGPVKII